MRTVDEAEKIIMNCGTSTIIKTITTIKEKTLFEEIVELIFYMHEYSTQEFSPKREIKDSDNRFSSFTISIKYLITHEKQEVYLTEKQWYELCLKIIPKTFKSTNEIDNTSFMTEQSIHQRLEWLSTHKDITYIGDYLYYTRLPQKFNENIVQKSKIAKTVLYIIAIVSIILFMVPYFVKELSLPFQAISFLIWIIIVFLNELILREYYSYFRGIELLVLNNMFLTKRFSPYLEIARKYLILQIIIILFLCLWIAYFSLYTSVLILVIMAISQGVRLYPLYLLTRITRRGEKIKSENFTIIEMRE